MPPLTPHDSLTSWTADVPSLVVCVAIGVAYVLAARRVGWPVARVTAFIGGLALVLLCTCSFLGVYADVLFWTRAVQNIVLFMAAPLLLALGAPLSLVREAARPVVRSRLRRLGHSAPAAALTMPVAVTFLLLVPLPLLYLSPLYAATLDHLAVDDLVRALLVLAGFVYYWTRLQVDPTPRGATHLVSFALSFAEMLVDGALGVIVWLGPLIAHRHYLDVGRTWGPTLQRDQTMGAIALWFGGDIIGIPYLVALFVQWFRDDSRDARRIDAELDRPGERPGLWWESDPRFVRGRTDAWPPSDQDT